MSIDATVVYVETKEDGSGALHLCDRVGSVEGRRDGIAGQRTLRFDKAPYEVTALNGLNIWGGSSKIILGDSTIAKREGYTRIVFVDDDAFRAAVMTYHQRRRASK